MEKTLAANENIHIEFMSYFDRDESRLVVEWEDGTDRMLSWKARYEKVVDSNSINSYFNYVDEFPDSWFVSKVLSDAFEKFFKISIVEKIESPVRSIDSKGLASSSVGSCKDIGIKIRIEPKFLERPPRAISVDLSYVLNRTYRPIFLEKNGDPLCLKRKYDLNPKNNFTITDVVNFNCVLTSGRFHFAGLTVLGSILGKSPQDSSETTTLTNMSFEAITERVK